MTHRVKVSGHPVLVLWEPRDVLPPLTVAQSPILRVLFVMGGNRVDWHSFAGCDQGRTQLPSHTLERQQLLGVTGEAEGRERMETKRRLGESLMFRKWPSPPVLVHLPPNCTGAHIPPPINPFT